MKLAVSKGLFKMCMILLLCLSMVLSAVGCIQDNTNDGTANKAESFNEISLEFFASLDEGDGEKFVTVLDCYAISRDDVFLKLEITQIYDDVFIEQYSGGREFIMLECNVICDMYESDLIYTPKVIIPIMIDITVEEDDTRVRSKLDVNEFKLWLLDFDYIYVRSHTYNQVFVAKGKSNVSVDVKINWCNISSYHLLPSADGKVCIEELDEFLDKNRVGRLSSNEIRGMELFCYSGISCENFEKNVKILSAYHDKKFDK